MTDRGIQRSKEQIRELVAEQAAAWLMRLEDPSASAPDRAGFADWLKASPAHVYEFLKARATWVAMSGEALERQPDQETLLRQVSEGEDADVIPLHGALREPLTPTLSQGERGKEPLTTTPSRERERGEKALIPALSRERESGKRRPLVAIAASLLVLTIAGAVYWVVDPFNSAHAVYQTAVGEQATHELPDGSTVALNTRSRVRLDWSEQYRDIYLDKGEALFEVARDPARPFRVWTGSSVVQAVGTRFNVYRQDDAVTVTVLEGRVEVSNAPLNVADPRDATQRDGAVPEIAPVVTRPKPVLLTAGEQARIKANEVIRAERLATPERSVGWQARRAVFEGTPLSEVIGEFNRYHEKPLQLADDSLATKRINGIFDPTDRDSLVAFLEEFENAQIEVQPNVIVVHPR